MAKKVVALVRDPVELKAARAWAKARSQDFTWADIAQRTSDTYIRALSARRPERSSR